MEHGVVRDVRSEFLKLFRCWQFAIDQQVACFKKIALLGELLDGVSTVAENPAIPVEIRDRAGRRACVRVALVEGDVPGLFQKFRDVDCSVVLGTDVDRHRERLLADFEGCDFF